jgi:DNA-binding MarR family transcriptional regulator
MVNELNVAVVGALSAALSGVAGQLISRHGMRRARQHRTNAHQELAWEQHQSPELARNLLVLEMVGDEIESTPVDVAVRARLTPAEVRKATDQLIAAGLLDTPSGGLVRLTDVGRSVLDEHRLEREDSVFHRNQRRHRVPTRRSLEDLDVDIENAVANLRAQHAHS